LDHEKTGHGQDADGDDAENFLDQLIRCHV
jgi:hypothetical protein